MCDRTTLYVSPQDIALGVSDSLHANYGRAGLTPPVTIIEGIDTVEVLHWNILDLGHGYYSEAAGVLYDMLDLMRNNTIPSKRVRLMPVRCDDGEYWRVTL